MSEDAKDAVDAMLTGEFGVSKEDFVAYMPGHSYIYKQTREMWPAASVNARIGPVLVTDKDGEPIRDADGEEQYIAASAWLDKNRPVEQMTWAPGHPMLITDRLVANGGWIKRLGVSCFNLYRPPFEIPGDPGEAERWVNHVHSIYDKEAAWHIIRYFAFKTQHPEIKINHALLLGGEQGIGKDTICAPLKYAVGPWNCIEVSPKHISGRFNGYAKAVMLRISEARDLGDVTRFDFYEQMKVLTAAPPEVLRVDEKHLREYDIFNVCGVIITTNYKTNGIYLPVDDRRHFVAWSQATKENFSEQYWNSLWGWYEAGGYGHAAAYLRTLDVSDFNPKAPPKKTAAFYEIGNANHAPEEAELADVIDGLSKPWTRNDGTTGADANGDPILEPPQAITIEMLKEAAGFGTETGGWISDRKNRRIIPHRLEKCGYEPVRNEAAEDGLWKIKGRRQAVYTHRSLSTRERIVAARKLAGVSLVSEVSDLPMETFSECKTPKCQNRFQEKTTDFTDHTDHRAGTSADESLPVCAQCGAPATDESPVQLCAIDGKEVLLHRACQADWLMTSEFPEFLRRTPRGQP